MGKKETENTTATSQGAETLYSIGELAAAVKTVFGKDMTPDVVTAALRKHGKNEYTVSEAKVLVKAFAEKEVN